MPASSQTQYARTAACLFVALCVLSASAAMGDQPADPDFPIRFVTQKVVVSGIKSVGKVAVVKLYKDKHLALTSRWDDNNIPAAVTMGNLQKKHGYKSTFYVYSNGLSRDVERKLLADGHAIQSHSLTHPGLAASDHNKIFREIILSRIMIESRTDVPVTAFAFPYNSFANDSRPGIQWEIYQLLRRSGYLHAAWSRPLPASMKRLSTATQLPGDGHPLEPWFGNLLKRTSLLDRIPHLSFCTHAWAYSRDNKWAFLEKQLKRYAGRSDYWYCTQPEYASYRFQWKHSRIENVKKTAEGVSFDLVRPSILDAGADVPLTLRIAGKAGNHAVVTVDGKPAAVDSADSSGLMFSVAYSKAEVSPAKIDWIDDKPTPAASKKFAGLSGGLELSADDKTLTCTLVNKGKPLSDIMITYRLPMAAAPGVIRRNVSRFDAGELTDSVSLTWPRRVLKYIVGKCLFVAQVDFVRDGKRGRLFLTRYKSIKTDDSPNSYIGWSGSVLAGKGGVVSNNADLVAKVPSDPTRTFVSAGGDRIKWTPIKNTWGNPCHVYSKPDSFVSTIIRSRSARKLKVVCKGTRIAWLNGKRVVSGSVQLNKGDNVFVALSGGATVLWLTNPNDSRAQGITYHATTSDPKRTASVDLDSPYRKTVQSWRICGLFPNPGVRPVKKGFDVDYLAEVGGETSTKIAPAKPVTWKGKSYAWQVFRSKTPRVNLMEFPPVKARKNRDDVLVYAMCYLSSDRARDVVFGVGSDDGYKLYLNGKLLRRERAFRGGVPDQELIDARLNKGVNTILLKVDQDFGGYEFFFSVMSPRFESIAGLDASLDKQTPASHE